MDIRNPQYLADGRIDCEVDHPQFGWIPYTAAFDDTEPMGQAIFAIALALGPAEYVAPEPAPPVFAPVSRLQAKAALLMAGKLAEVEAVVAASDALTQLAWAEAAEFRRDSPTIAALASGVLTEAELDDLFAAAALISF